MNKERILPYCKSQELTEEEINNVSGAGGNIGSFTVTCNVTFSGARNDYLPDGSID